MIVFRYMSDAAITRILGKELGEKFVTRLSMSDYWGSLFDFEVLAGSSMAAKRTMAQSMVMLTQILDNPQIQESLADINEEYIDFKPIISMWMEASEWKNGQDIIKPMSAEMKAEASRELKGRADASADAGQAAERPREVRSETTAGRSVFGQPH
jgi:hypothetical protein